VGLSFDKNNNINESMTI